MQIIEKQILNFQKFLNKYIKEFESETKEWFKNIPITDWVSPPAIRFFAVLSPKNSHFLRFIMKVMLKKELFFSYGRTELFVFVSQNEFNKISAKPALNFIQYRSVTVLYNTLFDIQTLETFPYSCFERYSDLPTAEDKKVGPVFIITFFLFNSPFY